MATYQSSLISIFIVICCLFLIIGTLTYARITDTKTEVLEKEQIEENLSSYQDEDLGYSYISSYVKHYGIGNIKDSKLNTIEMYLERDFYKDLPEERDMAKAICELYLEYFYDKTDKNNKTAVTDAVIHCLFASLDDNYAYYRTAEEYKQYLSSLQGTESFVGIGVMVNSETLEVIMVYKDSGAEEAGIKRGDFIYAVEGVTIEEASAAELTNMLRGEEGTKVKLTIERGDAKLEVEATRKALTEQSVTYEIDENNLGYIYVTQFLATTSEDFMEAVDYCVLNKADAIIIDMRYNPGGLLSSVIDMVDYLIPDADGRMITTYTQGKNEYTYYTDDGHGVNLPIAVICNGGTASAGELFTAAMRDFDDMGVIKAVVVGDTTYGKGVVQTSYDLIDKSGITFTIGYYNPPCDVNFDGVGIEPDIKVEEAEGEDLPLDVAKDEVMKLVYSINGTVGIYAPAV